MVGPTTETTLVLPMEVGELVPTTPMLKLVVIGRRLLQPPPATGLMKLLSLPMVVLVPLSGRAFLHVLAWLYISNAIPESLFLGSSVCVGWKGLAPGGYGCLKRLMGRTFLDLVAKVSLSSS